MNALTHLLDAAAAGDPHAAAELLPLVYDELRRLAAARLAAENPGHTLQATALVHEAYLRLVASGGGDAPGNNWNGRGHFFGAAAEAMRRILVEAARRKGRHKHGGGHRRVDLDALVTAAPEPDDDLIALSEALDDLAAANAKAAEVVKLRYFAGLTGREAAEAVGVSPRKADQFWAYARAWLLERLNRDEPPGRAHFEPKRRTEGVARAITTPEWPMDEQSLFAELLDLPDAPARAARLDAAAGDDPKLRERMERLLARHAAAGSFLEHPVTPHGTAAYAPAPEADASGTAIGPYKLLELIGEGGMGAVYMAEQTEPVRRRVAVKVIKPGMDSTAVVARFTAERQALALMDHPNIARVFDGGQTGERGESSPRFERSDDRSSDRGVDTPRSPGGRPYFVMELVRGLAITDYCDRAKLPIRERLALFAQVCRAVQHAHTKGVIHRDIKPSNVLVTVIDGVSVPKVIDFGVAKATGAALTEQTLFTGFHQLVGTLLYMSPEQAEMSGVDVDTRADVYSLGVLLYELLTGTTPFDPAVLRTAGFDEMRRIIREEEPARPSRRVNTLADEQSSTVADRRGVDPRRLGRLMRSELDWVVMRALDKDRNRRYETAAAFAADIERYLSDAPVEACPPSRRYRFGKFVLRNRVALATAATLAVAVLAMAGAVGWVMWDAGIRRSVAEQRAGEFLFDADRFQERGQWPEALAAVNRAETVLGNEGNGDLRRRVGRRIADLKFVQRLTDLPFEVPLRRDEAFDYDRWDRRYAEAFREYGIDVDVLEPGEVVRQMPDGLRIREQLLVGIDDWLLIRRGPITAGRPDSRCEWLLAVATAIEAEPWRNRFRETWTRRDWTGFGEVVRAAPLDRLPPHQLARIGAVLTFKEAAPILREAQRRAPDAFWLNHGLATRLVFSDQPRVLDEAIGFYRAALVQRPADPNVLTGLGRALTKAGRIEEGVATIRRAIQFNPDHAPAHHDLGNALAKQGMPDAAITAFRESLRLNPADSGTHASLGQFFLQTRRWDEASAEYAAAIRLGPKAADYHIKFGMAQEGKGALGGAVAAYRAAVAISPNSADGHNHLAWFLAACADPAFRDPAEAVRSATRATELSPNNAAYRNTLGVAHYRAGNWKDAVAELEKAMTLTNGGDGHDWLFLAMAHWQLGDKDQARQGYEKAARWMAKNDPRNEELLRFRSEAATLIGVDVP